MDNSGTVRQHAGTAGTRRSARLAVTPAPVADTSQVSPTSTSDAVASQEGSPADVGGDSGAGRGSCVPGDDPAAAAAATADEQATPCHMRQEQADANGPVVQTPCEALVSTQQVNDVVARPRGAGNEGCDLACAHIALRWPRADPGQEQLAAPCLGRRGWAVAANDAQQGCRSTPSGEPASLCCDPACDSPVARPRGAGEGTVGPGGHETASPGQQAAHLPADLHVDRSGAGEEELVGEHAASPEGDRKPGPTAVGLEPPDSAAGLTAATRAGDTVKAYPHGRVVVLQTKQLAQVAQVWSPSAPRVPMSAGWHNAHCWP